MANGVQLATAYISLNVRTDDIKKQVSSALSSVGGQGRQVGQSIGSKIAQGIKASLGMSSLSVSMFNPMEIAGVRWAVKAGTAIGGALKKAIMGALGGLGIGAIFGVGGVLSAGLDRLKIMQRAEVQLSLKLSPAEINKVKDAVERAVKGTPISLDAAMSAAPRLVNAGLNADEINQYVKAVANLSAATGGQADFERLDLILSQIRSKSKLTGEEMMQLIEAGVDVRGMLKETFGWDDKTLENNLKRNKVGLNEILKASDQLYGKDGGLAQKMGKTLEGALGNLRASVARLGANFLAAIFGKEASADPLEDYAAGISKITDGLNDMSEWVKTHREDIHNVFRRIGDAASWVGDKVEKLPKFFTAVGDAFGKVKQKAGDVADWFGSAWDKATNAVSRVGDKVKTVFDSIKTKIGTIVDDLKKKFDGIFGENGWFAQQFDKLGKIVDKVREVLGLGEATANAAGPGSPDAVPFNPGPMRPTGPYSSRAGLAPGTRLDGSDQQIAGMPGAATTTGSQRVLSYDQKITGQKFAWDCGPGAAEIILNGQGVIKSEGELIAEMGTTEAGTNFGGGNISGPLNKAVPGANYREMPGNVSADKLFADLSQSINAGRGAMLNWNTEAGGPIPVGVKGTEATPYSGPIAHYVAVMGVDPTDQSVLIADPKDGRQYWISAENAAALSKNRGYVAAGFASGGHVWGAGTATSDSIPALLSNGEHVLTAADVKKMGGQSGVYAFRNALQSGLLPGFAPGGAVDPGVVQDAQDSVANLNNAYAVAQAQLNELIQAGDATPSQLLQANQNLSQTKRDLDNAVADLPIISSGGTPPDRSPQNRVSDLTDQMALLQQQLADQQESGADVPYSQQLQQNYQLESLKRERNQAIADLQGTGGATDYGSEFIRSMGLIPAGAGNTGVAGTSSLAGFINMGNSVVSGLIDTGKNLAQQAAGTAVALGTAGAGAGPGAGIAAQIATSYGIELAANTAKRLSAYGFQMAGIGADALVEQLFPFGMPRWLGYDYTGFMPQIGIQQAFTSTIEKMGSDAIKKQFAGQQGMNIPPEPGPVNTTPSGPSAGGSASVPITAPQQPMQVGAPGVNANGQFTFGIDPLNPTGAGGGGGGGSWAKGGAIGIYDNGGVLKPGQLALNASRTPESILTKQQWNAMMANASTAPRDNAPLVQNLYAQDMQDAIRQLEKVKRRDMMQYAGRP